MSRADGPQEQCHRGQWVAAWAGASEGHFGRTLVAQLRHACVDPWVARAPFPPRAKQRRVALPRDLLADGVAFHAVEVGRAVAAYVVELAPEQLAVQRDGRLRVLASLGVDLWGRGAGEWAVQVQRLAGQV